jgi:hypothetical protein
MAVSFGYEVILRLDQLDILLEWLNLLHKTKFTSFIITNTKIWIHYP